jgi:long-chain acyl-CoA synthetase
LPAKTGLYDVRAIRDLRDLVNQSAEIYADADAFLVKDPRTGSVRSISFRHFRQDIRALGAQLRVLGLSGERIAIISENRYEWCVSYLATVCGTGVVVPIDKELPDHEMIALLGRSGAAAVLCSGAFASDLNAQRASLPDLRHILDFDAESGTDQILSYEQQRMAGRLLCESAKPGDMDPPIDPEVMNMLIFTSGTTGLPKGVMLSHKNICADIMAVSRLIYADNNDLIMSILPLHHTYECTAGFLTMVYLGVSICFCEGLRHITKNNLQEYKPSMMMSVPLILENVFTKIVKKAKKEKRYPALVFGLTVAGLLYRLGIDVRRQLFSEVHETLGGNMRLIIAGAAALNPRVSRALRAMGLNIMQGYGLTECSPIVSVNRLDNYRDASAGFPLPGVEVAIDNPGPDGIGEIVVRGDIVMLGYYENPEATRAVLVDGALHTGDNGYIDKNGFLFISGRQKNVIVTKNGKNIFPEDVELYLNKSVYIKESLVYGIDGGAGEDTLVCARIVPNMDVIVEQFGQVPVQENCTSSSRARWPRPTRSSPPTRKSAGSTSGRGSLRRPPPRKSNAILNCRRF